MAGRKTLVSSSHTLSIGMRLIFWWRYESWWGLCQGTINNRLTASAETVSFRWECPSCCCLIYQVPLGVSVSCSDDGISPEYPELRNIKWNVFTPVISLKSKYRWITIEQTSSLWNQGHAVVEPAISRSEKSSNVHNYILELYSR